MCCSLSPAGERLLLEAAERGGGRLAGATARPSWSSGGAREHGLGRVRRALHAAGWALALAALTDAREIRGAHLSTLVAPRPRGRPPGPDGLALPGGRAAHDFLRTIPSGDRVEAERFETIRPDATIVLCGGRPDRQDVDLLIELDDRCARPGWANKIERYDHFLSGWAELVERYRRGGRAVPAVVFVCRDAPRARECARRADLLLSACHAYAGSYPQSWEHPGRARVVFAAEREVHEGQLGGWGVPPLPAPLRSETTVDGSPVATAIRAPLPLGCDE
jgi:hypothetical protein